MTRPLILTGITRDGGREEFTAYPTGVSGLVVARSAFHPEPDSRWCTVHARTGLSLGYCFTGPEEALALAIAIGPVTDWTQPGRAVRTMLQSPAFKTARTPFLAARCRLWFHGRSDGALHNDNGVVA
jgi:hypothetical protein